MESFFFTCGQIDEIEIKELLLRRYHTLSFINDFTADELLKFIQLAAKKEMEDKIYQQWCAMLPALKEFKTFKEFYDMVTGANIDKRPAAQIIHEIKQLHDMK